MKIRFIEERILLDNSRVMPGEERDFDDDEAAAFVNNGVAVKAGTRSDGKAGLTSNPEPQTSNLNPLEVTDNG